MTPPHYVPPSSGAPPYPSYTATAHPTSSSNPIDPSSYTPSTPTDNDRTYRPPVPLFPDQERRPTTAPATIRPIPHRPLSGRGRGQIAPPMSGYVSPSTPNTSGVYGYAENRGRGEVARYSMPSQSSRVQPPPGAYMNVLERPLVGASRRHSFPRHLHRSTVHIPALLAPVAATSTSLDTSGPGPTVTALTTPPHRPPLPADRSTAAVEGFQTDYIRPTSLDIRRPCLITPKEIGDGRPVGSTGASGNYPFVSILPPPTEAYLILRQRGEPAGGWSPIPQEEGSDWTVRLTCIQEPQMGLALGDKSLKTATPRLDPPLVIQIELVQADGQVVPDNSTLLEKKLAYMPLHISLISAEDDGDRDLIRRISDSDSGSGSSGSASGSGTGSDAESTSLQISLVGPTFGTAKSAIVNGTRGRYFVFSDLRVRPSGDFRIQARLMNVLGPGPSGTSTGITPIATSTITAPFEVYTEQDFPGVLQPTALTSSLIVQGVLKPRSDGWGGESSSDGSD